MYRGEVVRGKVEKDWDPWIDTQLEGQRETVSWEGPEKIEIYVRNDRSSALVELSKKEWKEREAIDRVEHALTMGPRFCIWLGGNGPALKVELRDTRGDLVCKVMVLATRERDEGEDMRLWRQWDAVKQSTQAWWSLGDFLLSWKDHCRPKVGSSHYLSHHNLIDIEPDIGWDNHCFLHKNSFRSHLHSWVGVLV